MASRNGWGEPLFYRQPETENVKCRTCRFRMVLGTPTFVGCQYILIMYKSRGTCPTSECTLYEEGDLKKFTHEWNNPIQYTTIMDS